MCETCHGQVSCCKQFLAVVMTVMQAADKENSDVNMIEKDD